ncbi:polysaccharide biosynthesis/export family protein [Roseospira visakhapatnamensis]|uniref:Protein involved in polysaccharide export with SLBB domain n=1 Tax=Roseospira visakhapatnamensis TaxID=390880 RepID=A0A7W6RBA3_9PROT|nr:polysaccharide biosynthesis/export family protein [Roseospira visakhapatnamensis]MBB4265297.1 protein involved in polysaccharide export with SLBB domain [Roseospira visakhapatnamensis]
MRLPRRRRVVLGLVGLLLTAGCTGESAYYGTGPDSAVYMPERLTPPPPGTTAREAFVSRWERAAMACAEAAPGPGGADAPLGVVPRAPPGGGAALPLSSGDRVRLSLPEGEDLEGLYVIGLDGALTVPLVGAIPAAGRPLAEVNAALAKALVDKGLFRRAFAQPTLTITARGPARVNVSGAVFQPGTVEINARAPEDLAGQDTVISGDASGGRRVSAALRAAAGVRPDADLSRVELRRGPRAWTLDLRGLMTGTSGAAGADIALTDGDTVHVPEKGCFQPDLARPSAVTTPGIRVYMSNLTEPASSNAQSAIGKDQSNLPYGTRFLQALVAANCVGGIPATNASRHAVLISTNPVTQRSEVIQRPIETLVRDTDRDTFNPVLLPGDALACYDSDVTTLRDIAKGFVDVLSPLALAGLLAR